MGAYKRPLLHAMQLDRSWWYEELYILKLCQQKIDEGLIGTELLQSNTTRSSFLNIECNKYGMQFHSNIILKTINVNLASTHIM